jgi:large subunit ribosomal protein L10
MNRSQKTEAVATLEQDMSRATVAVLAEYRGLTAGQMNRLRRAVREADGRCRVAKNTLAKRSIGSSRYQKLELHLTGPVALILGFGDPVVMAKIVVKFAEELPHLELKAGVLDGEVLPASEVEALAKLPPREVLLGQLLGLLQAPATQLLRTLNEPATRLARVVDAIGKRAAEAPAESGS